MKSTAISGLTIINLDMIITKLHISPRPPRHNALTYIRYHYPPRHRALMPPFFVKPTHHCG